jgi:hypothetical protein
MTKGTAGSRTRRGRLASAAIGLFVALAVAAVLFAYLAYEVRMTNQG